MTIEKKKYIEVKKINYLITAINCLMMTIFLTIPILNLCIYQYLAEREGRTNGLLEIYIEKRYIKEE